MQTQLPRMDKPNTIRFFFFFVSFTAYIPGKTRILNFDIVVLVLKKETSIFNTLAQKQGSLVSCTHTEDQLQCFPQNDSVTGGGYTLSEYIIMFLVGNSFCHCNASVLTNFFNRLWLTHTCSSAFPSLFHTHLHLRLFLHTLLLRLPLPLTVQRNSSIFL